MIAHRMTKRIAWLGACGLVVIGSLLASRAYAKLSANTIFPVALIAGNGRQIVVSGPVTGTAGEHAHQRVCVTQRSTGAVAEGQAVFRLTGSAQRWEIRATTTGQAAFAEGPATAVAMSQTTDQGQPTDAHQWLVNIDLVNE